MKRICFVTRDLLGPVRNGGIGTAFAHLARLLAADGHAVTVLYTPGEQVEDATFAHWVESYANEKITLVKLPAYENMQFRNSATVRQAYLVYRWLKERDGAFDLVHFHDWYGLGAYTTLARKQGLAFATTQLCVQLHAQVLWHVQHSAAALDQYELLEADALEKIAIEHADMVVSPSRYMLEWTKQRGVKLPEDARVIQNVMPEVTAAPTPAAPIRELVFFGRLESRKGLDIFCEALRRLPEQARRPVSFLGKEGKIGDIPARDYIAAKLGGIVEFQILPTFTSDIAQEYLQGAGRLAVIASRAENSPYVVLECLAGNIPFIAAGSGGTPELVALQDRARSLFAPNAAALAATLASALTQVSAPVALAVPLAATREAWKALHVELAAPREVVRTEAPRISVCIAHRNRPELLQRALASLESQHTKPFEVIVVDDGSDTLQAQEYLKRLETEFSAKGWKLLRQENRYAGAARNTAAQAAQGEWLLFMDDDNIAGAHELEIFGAATCSGADIYTCVMELSTEAETPRRYFVPLGDGASVGMYENSYGDVNALVRRELFTKLGGFTEEFGVGLEDMELFAKASLAGYRIETVPEALFRYRENSDGVQQSSARDAAMARALRPYLAAFPAISPALMLAQGMHISQPKMHEHYAGLERSFQEVRSSNDELKLAKTALDGAVKELSEERARLQGVLDSMGAETMRFIQRLQAHGITRLMLALKVKSGNAVMDILAKLKR